MTERNEFEIKQLFFRATFAAASEENMTAAIERFGFALREVFALE